MYKFAEKDLIGFDYMQLHSLSPDCMIVVE